DRPGVRPGPMGRGRRFRQRHPVRGAGIPNRLRAHPGGRRARPGNPRRNGPRPRPHSGPAVDLPCGGGGHRGLDRPCRGSTRAPRRTGVAAYRPAHLRRQHLPTSDAQGKGWARQVIADLAPATVVDVGPGDGTYVRLARDVTPDTWWAGVEAWGPYVTQFGLDRLYDQVVVADVRHLDPHTVALHPD